MQNEDYLLRTRLRPLPFGSIVLTDAYQKNAFEKEIAYLLSLEEGRLLAGFYENAGIKTPFVRYGGWESMLIGGHTLGHYLSALAQAEQNAGLEDGDRAALARKRRRIIAGLAECQRHSRGEPGFLWGAPAALPGDAEAQFDNVERGRTEILHQAWVPWYTMHKLLAGLIDAARLTGDEQALKVAMALGDWTVRRVGRWSDDVRRAVLAVEYGGMNDCLYDLFALTGRQDYAAAAHIFDEEPLFDRILSGDADVLNGLHANTTIPKILGALKRYLVSGCGSAHAASDETRYLRVAETFFGMVLRHHTYVTGGNSEWEHFGRDDVLDAERTNCNCETCNVYNMLKLARLLFCVTGKAVYADYYDNAFTNTILSSQDPETGMTTYFQPMASGYFKVFSAPYSKFWCCTGSGMESFTKLAEGMAYTDGADLYLERFSACRIAFGDALLSVACDFPLDDTLTVAVLRAPRPFTLRLRIPDWAAAAPQTDAGSVGTKVCTEGGHLLLPLAEGASYRIRIPVAVTASGLPDDDRVAAFCYGGAVLSADLGREAMTQTQTGIEVNVPARKLAATESIYFADAADVRAHPERYVVRRGDRFYLEGGDIPVVFDLHYRRFRERYAIYWYLCEGERRAEETRRVPVDTVQPGYGQYETDDLHALREEHSVGNTAGIVRRFARAGGWFEYDLRVDPQAGAHRISFILLGADAGKSLSVAVGGEEVFSRRLTRTEERYEAFCILPGDVIARAMRSKHAFGEVIPVITVRFSGVGGEESANVCEAISVCADR